MRALMFLSFLLLAACGQSGDLYLPPEQPEPVAETPPADEEQKKEPPEEGP